MARWTLLILGFLCIVPPAIALGFFLYTSLFERVQSFPSGHVVIETLGVKKNRPPLVVAAALGLTLIVLGLMMPATKLRG